MNGLSDRLKKVRDHLGLNQEEMANLVGMKRRGYQDTEQRGSAKTDVIARLVDCGINGNWLLTGKGPMLLVDVPAPDVKKRTDVIHQMEKMAAVDLMRADAKTYAASVASNKNILNQMLSNIGVQRSDSWVSSLVELTAKYDIQESDLSTLTSLVTSDVAVDDEFALIPLYDAQVSAGHGASMENAKVLSHLAFRRDWLNQAGLNANNLSAVQVSGDSMLGVVANGDTVLVDHSRRDVSREGLYVLRLDDHLYVKHLQKTLDGVNIISANKVYSTISVPRERMGDLEVIGRAVWSASWLS